MRNIALAIAIFIVLLIALSFGERLGVELFSWFVYIFSFFQDNLQHISAKVQVYVNQNWGKVLLALALTIPLSYWVSRQNHKEGGLNKTHSKRKISIVLAVFVGCLGVHRFYLGQLGWGFIYLILFYIFTPLAILVGWIDALRYLLMGDDEFKLRY